MVNLAEIIETYWNVNFVVLFPVVRVVPEIIETYWNVNCPGQCVQSVSDFRNNRNILECKCSTEFMICFVHFRNNRNILECKCSE